MRLVSLAVGGSGTPASFRAPSWYAVQGLSNGLVDASKIHAIRDRTLSGHYVVTRSERDGANQI
jgi:hypothetical protein